MCCLIFVLFGALIMFSLFFFVFFNENLWFQGISKNFPPFICVNVKRKKNKKKPTLNPKPSLKPLGTAQNSWRRCDSECFFKLKATFCHTSASLTLHECSALRSPPLSVHAPRSLSLSLLLSLSCSLCAFRRRSIDRLRLRCHPARRDPDARSDPLRASLLVWHGRPPVTLSLCLLGCSAVTSPALQGGFGVEPGRQKSLQKSQRGAFIKECSGSRTWESCG